MTCDKICPPHAPVWSAHWDVLSLSLSVSARYRGVMTSEVSRHSEIPILANRLNRIPHISYISHMECYKYYIHRHRCTVKSDLSSDLYTFGSVLLFFYGTPSHVVSSSWSLGQSRFTIGTGNPWSPLRSTPSTVISSRAQLTFQACAQGHAGPQGMRSIAERHKNREISKDQRRTTPEYWIRLNLFIYCVC